MACPKANPPPSIPNKNYIYQLLIKVSEHLFCYMKKAEFQSIFVLFAEKKGALNTRSSLPARHQNLDIVFMQI